MKLEKGDVVYCESSDALVIIIKTDEYIENSYWCEFGWSFGKMEYLIEENRLTLISKGDFK